jgi:serine/threonine-protein kinase
MSIWDLPSLRQAIAAYEQAVALDPTFAQAWSRLGRAQALLYSNSTPTPAGAEAARRASERALALAPAEPDGHRALGLYYSYVVRDALRALTEDSTALALAPGDAELLATVGTAELTLSRWEAARGHLEQAVHLNPRAPRPAQALARVLVCTRHYLEAKQTLDHALELVPANPAIRIDRAEVEVAQGDLAAAQKVLRAAPKELDPTVLVAGAAQYYGLIWVLDEAQQQLLLRLTPSAFDNDRGAWGIVLAQTLALRGNVPKARAYADSARLALEQQLQAAPQAAQLHVALGLALAYLGRKAEAIREGERAVVLLPVERDAIDGADAQNQLAHIYLLVGEPEKALDHLEPLLRIPYFLSTGWLKIDPTFAPLRGNPRFERLVNGT